MTIATRIRALMSTLSILHEEQREMSLDPILTELGKILDEDKAEPKVIVICANQVNVDCHGFRYENMAEIPTTELERST